MTSSHLEGAREPQRSEVTEWRINGVICLDYGASSGPSVASTRPHTPTRLFIQIRNN